MAHATLLVSAVASINVRATHSRKHRDRVDGVLEKVLFPTAVVASSLVRALQEKTLEGRLGAHSVFNKVLKLVFSASKRVGTALVSEL